MRHMCIPESTAHLSFHAHSIHTPMTGIPELSPPKRIQSPNGIECVNGCDNRKSSLIRCDEAALASMGRYSIF